MLRRIHVNTLLQTVANRVVVTIVIPTRKIRQFGILADRFPKISIIMAAGRLSFPTSRSKAMLRAVIACAALLACLSFGAFAQPPGEKKPDDAGKSKAIEKNNSKDGAKSKLALDQIRLPGDIIIVVVDDLLKASELIPNKWIMDLDEWRATKVRLE